MFKIFVDIKKSKTFKNDHGKPCSNRNERFLFCLIKINDPKKARAYTSTPSLIL